MKNIRLSNFRSLKDTGEIELSPITILLGQNSSGKSTFLRSWALLKQSIGVRAREPFLWVGELVDFGGFAETLSTFADEDMVSLTYEMEIPIYHALARMRAMPPVDTQKVRVVISERGRKNPSGKESFEYSFQVDKDVIDFSLSADGQFQKFEINGRNYLRYVSKWLNVKVWRGPIPSFTRYAESDSFEETTEAQSFATGLNSFINSRVHGRSGEARRRNLAFRLTRTPLDRLLQMTRTDVDTKWNRIAEGWTEQSTDFQELRNLVIGYRFIDIASYISDYTAATLESVKYVTPLRANAERYYRKQGLAVHELDPRGTNFALFMDNMSIMERRNFSEWSEQFFGVSIGVTEAGGHLSLHLKPAGDAVKEINIADTGFGFSQMFPILAQLWSAKRASAQRGPQRTNVPVFFAIEQPELHLHPRLQAKLADVFVSAIHAARQGNVDLRLIVETHSEYLVNRLGHLIAKKQFESTAASVLIFERDEFKEPTSIRHAKYSVEGYLENWPYGFFEPSI